jgi:hypothetical protein
MFKAVIKASFFCMLYFFFFLAIGVKLFPNSAWVFLVALVLGVVVGLGVARWRHIAAKRELIERADPDAGQG